jgi:UDP-glucose 4-epimerase
LPVRSSSRSAISSIERSIPEPTLYVSPARSRRAPYGASKWAAEAYVRTWKEASGVPQAICRLANVYGPRQNPHGEAGVVAIFSLQLLRGDTPTLFGFGKPTRDYVHVHDVARALVAALGHTGVYNVSTGVETTVSHLFDLLRAAAGVTVEPKLPALRPGELERSCLDSSRAREELGWRPGWFSTRDSLRPIENSSRNSRTRPPCRPRR